MAKRHGQGSWGFRALGWKVLWELEPGTGRKPVVLGPVSVASLTCAPREMIDVTHSCRPPFSLERIGMQQGKASVPVQPCPLFCMEAHKAYRAGRRVSQKD